MKLRGISLGIVPLFVAAIGLEGCIADTEGPPEAASTEAAITTAPPPEATMMCPSTRWIGPSGNTRGCPKTAPSNTGTWSVEPLFGANGARIPGLMPFCSYTWRPSQPGTAPDTSVLPSTVSRDCQIVAAQSAGSVNWRELSDAFTARAGGTPNLPRVRAKTWVSVIDTMPNATSGTIDGAKPGNSPHGFALANLIQNLACPRASNQPCSAEIRTYLAMPRTTPVDVDTVNGGYFGSLGDLAVAIKAAVDQWYVEAPIIPADTRSIPRSAARRAPLILNLSLGWDPRWGGSGLANDPARNAVVAVAAAIAHARCMGAIVFAASGNDTGGPAPGSGALYPAAWESLPGPNANICAVLEGSGYIKPLPTFVANEPLVFAVGGVGVTGQTLPASRPKSRPNLVAPGAFAIAPSYSFVPSPTGPTMVIDGTDMLTGTSVSTAVASAAAAAAWAYLPGADAAGIVWQTYVGGTDTGLAAEVCPAGTISSTGCGTARRITVCGAVRSICGVAPTACSFAPTCVAPTDPPLTLSAASQHLILAAYAGVTPVERPAQPLQVFPLVCARKGYARSVPTDPCPDRQYYSTPTIPWVYPQPGNPTCPSCGIYLTKFGYISMPTAQITAPGTGTLYSPSLVYALKGGGSVTYDLSSYAPTLTGGQKYVFYNVVPAGIDQATIDSSALVYSVPGTYYYSMPKSVRVAVPVYR